MFVPHKRPLVNDRHLIIGRWAASLCVRCTLSGFRSTFYTASEEAFVPFSSGPILSLCCWINLPRNDTLSTQTFCSCCRCFSSLLASDVYAIKSHTTSVNGSVVPRTLKIFLQPPWLSSLGGLLCKHSAIRRKWSESLYMTCDGRERTWIAVSFFACHNTRWNKMRVSAIKDKNNRISSCLVCMPSAS